MCGPLILPAVESLNSSFDCYTLLLAPVFHSDVLEEHRQESAVQFWNAEACCIDLWMGQALRGTLCDDPEELLEPALCEFVGTMFSRCMITSVFAERMFGPMTSWTSGCAHSSRLSLHGLASRSLNSTFNEVVNRVQRPLQGPRARMRRSCNSGKFAPGHGPFTNAWQVYVEAHPPPENSNKQERCVHIKSKQRAWKFLSVDAQRPYKEEASRRRAAARGRREMDDTASSQVATDIGSGPWGVWAHPERGQPKVIPLARHALSVALDQGTPDQVAKYFKDRATRIVQEDAEFPHNIHARHACHVGECRHGLGPGQEKEFQVMARDIRLILEHHGLQEGSLLCLDFRYTASGQGCALMVGSYLKTHKLQCDMVLLQQAAGDAREFAFRKHGRDTEYPGWPMVQSESQFILGWVGAGLGAWEVYLLKTVPDQVWTLRVESETLLDLIELRRKEELRLEQLAAMRLFKKIAYDGPPRPSARGRGRGRGRGGARRGRGGRGRDRERSEVLAARESQSESESLSETSAEPEEGDPAPPDPPPPPPPPPPGAPPRPLARPPRERHGEPYGRHWILSHIKRGDEIIGHGATCKGHEDTEEPWNICKTHATIGRSGLTPDDMRLRVKRWLIAGLDDGAWPEDTRRTQHVAMGGMHLIEFAAGLSEEACDRIAAALPPPP